MLEVAVQSADGQLDRPSDAYFSNTDQGIEAYGGPTSDPNKDVIYATNAFVQHFQP